LPGFNKATTSMTSEVMLMNVIGSKKAAVLPVTCQPNSSKYAVPLNVRMQDAGASSSCLAE